MSIIYKHNYILLLFILFAAEPDYYDGVGEEFGAGPSGNQRGLGQYGYPSDPMSDRAKGYLLKGKVKNVSMKSVVEQGIVTYPVVPKGVIMLRLIPTATHTDGDVEQTINAFKEVKEKLFSKKYVSDKIAGF